MWDLTGALDSASARAIFASSSAIFSATSSSDASSTSMTADFSSFAPAGVEGASGLGLSVEVAPEGPSSHMSSPTETTSAAASICDSGTGGGAGGFPPAPHDTAVVGVLAPL